MKTGIGIRVTPSCVYYCISSESESCVNLLSIDKVALPKSLKTPEQLKIIRLDILDVMKLHSVDYATIRIMENISQNISIDRMYVEGVMLELLASSDVKGYKPLSIRNITTLLKCRNGEVKDLINGIKDYPQIDGFDKMKKEEREAILSSLCALKLC